MVRVIENRSYYDPERVRNLIATSYLSDPMPMIVLCHKHNYIEFLTDYLVRNNQIHALYTFCRQEKNHKFLPRVLFTLLKFEVPELTQPHVDSLLLEAGECNKPEMIKVFEDAKKLVQLYDWLKKQSQNDKSPEVNTAYGKVLVELDLNPRLFMEHNKFYDHSRLGRFC